MKVPSGLIVLAALLFCRSAVTQEKPPDTTDRVSLLYSSRMIFDAHGVPLITVGVYEALRKVGISSDRGLLVDYTPAGDPRARARLIVPSGESWIFRLTQSTPGKVKHWVGVESVSFDEKEQLRKLSGIWRRRKLKPQIFEVGSVFGLRGRVIDNRSYILAVNPQDTQDQAATQAGVILGAFGTKAFVHHHLTRRPTGRIAMLDNEGGMRDQAEDLIVIVPADQKGSIVIEDLEGIQKSEWRGERRRTYAGSVLVTLNHAGKMVVINKIGVEKLLEGLVPAEMYANAPMEALKAQAVVARGEVFAKIGSRHFLDPYLLCASTHCQVYAGMDVEHPRTTQAVRATRGELLFRGPALVDSVYSASCGGHTENNELVWTDPAKPELRGIADMTSEQAALSPNPREDVGVWLRAAPTAFCSHTEFGASTLYRWTHTIRSDDMDRLVARIKPIGQVVSIQVLSRGVSARACMVRVIGTQGELVVQRELPIRRLFGGLKSAMFEVEVRIDDQQMPSEFVFRGGGWGHGVGMCQMGAIGMAMRGYDFRQILQHYFQGAGLHRLYGNDNKKQSAETQ